MTEIISVRFKSGGKQYYFDPAGQEITEGQAVIVETGKGLELGYCTRGNCMVEDTELVQPLRPVVRIASEEDTQHMEENRAKEAEAMKIAEAQIERHELDMKLVSVEYSFDGSKIVFFFTSDGRVDFRNLVKDLAGIFRARIELRQIGVRDEARMLGGLGICGRPFCCAQFLNEFQPVSIKMAKTQNLSLNPTKISGTCGRLMCCLKYEEDAYEDALKRCPKLDSFVECPNGVGTITSVNLLKEEVKVALENSTEQPRTYRACEIRVIRNGKGRRPEDYIAPPPEELEKLRYIPPEGENHDRSQRAETDLSAVLDEYLGLQNDPVQRNDGSRKDEHTGHGKNKGKTAKKTEGQPAETQHRSKEDRKEPQRNKNQHHQQAKKAKDPAVQKEDNTHRNGKKSEDREN